jgi:hypothetical protein
MQSHEVPNHVNKIKTTKWFGCQEPQQMKLIIDVELVTKQSAWSVSETNMEYVSRRQMSRLHGLTCVLALTSWPWKFR